MESTKNNLLDWIDINLNAGHRLNPIDRFLYDNEPADAEQSEKYGCEI